MTIVDLHCRNAFCTPALSRSISYLVGNALVRTRMSGSDKRGREGSLGRRDQHKPNGWKSGEGYPNSTRLQNELKRQGVF